MNLRKKGLSEVVATVLLVLIGIAAVSIVAAFLVPFVRTWLQEGSSCVNYEDYFYFYESSDEIGYNCYRNETSYFLYAVSIGAKGGSNESGSKISGFALAFRAIGESASVSALGGEPVNAEDGGLRMLNSSKDTFLIPKTGEVRTYVFNSSQRFNRVEVQPILSSGKRCDSSDFISIANICDYRLNLNPS